MATDRQKKSHNTHSMTFIIMSFISAKKQKMADYCVSSGQSVFLLFCFQLLALQGEDKRII